MGDFKEWSLGWIKEGQYISYARENLRYYEYVLARDLARFEYPWGNDDTEAPVTIDARDTSGPFTPDVLEITRGYLKETNLNQLWQIIFGIKGQVYIYVELPTDTHRHGIPKAVKPSNVRRRVSHFEEWMSPYTEPTFLTEHFLMRPDCSQINFEAYNPNSINLTDVWLNLFINKLQTERLGTEQNGAGVPTRDRFRETLDKLIAHAIPCRPITLLPVTAPAEAPSGE